MCAGSKTEAQIILHDLDNFDVAIVNLMIPTGYGAYSKDPIYPGFDVLDDLIQRHSLSPEKILILTTLLKEDSITEKINKRNIPDDNYIMIGSILPDEIRDKIYQIIDINIENSN